MCISGQLTPFVLFYFSLTSLPVGLSPPPNLRALLEHSFGPGVIQGQVGPGCSFQFYPPLLATSGAPRLGAWG